MNSKDELIAARLSLGKEIERRLRASINVRRRGGGPSQNLDTPESPYHPSPLDLLKRIDGHVKEART